MFYELDIEQSFPTIRDLLMLKPELFDVLKDQLFDRLVNFDNLRKQSFSSASSKNLETIFENWSNYAINSAMALNQISTASRLERYEYQETLEENVKSLKNNPKAYEVISISRDQSILLEFFTRVLSLLYYESITEGTFKGTKDFSFIDDYALQIHELSEIILFLIGKELFIDEEYLKMMVSIGKMNFESNLYENLLSFKQSKKEKHKELILERQIKNLRYKGSLYKDYYSKILELAKENFWWEDQLLEYYIHTKATNLFSEARNILLKNPLDPSLLLTIDFEIALCQGQAINALGSYYLEHAIESLMNDNHQNAYDFFMLANKNFNESLSKLNKLPIESLSSKQLLQEIKENIGFTGTFTTLVALTCSIIEISSSDFSKQDLNSRIESLVSLSEAPLANVEFYNQSEYLNTVGFILENLRILGKHEVLTKSKIQQEIEKGFQRLGVIFRGRIDNLTRAFLQLPWNDDQNALQVKTAFCETEETKLQDIIISILLMPPFIQERKSLVARSKALLNIITSESYRLKSLKEKNATKTLCLLVKSHLRASDSFHNLEKGAVLDDLKIFVQEEFNKTFIQSHLKETSILQTGNQYFFARYLLRSLPDILSATDFTKVPEGIASLIIESHGSIFDSLITIWERISSHYEAIFLHKEKYHPSSDDTIDWYYLEKKMVHTKGVMLFFKACQSVVKAQEYAIIKEKAKAEKLFNEASQSAKKSAEILNSILDTLKTEVQQTPKEIYNFATFCNSQIIKLSQGKKVEELPIKDFVVLIGIISSSL